MWILKQYSTCLVFQRLILQTFNLKLYLRYHGCLEIGSQQSSPWTWQFPYLILKCWRGWSRFCGSCWGWKLASSSTGYLFHRSLDLFFPEKNPLRMGNSHVNCRGTPDNSFKTQELTPIMRVYFRSTLNVTKYKVPPFQSTELQLSRLCHPPLWTPCRAHALRRYAVWPSTRELLRTYTERSCQKPALSAQRLCFKHGSFSKRAYVVCLFLSKHKNSFHTSEIWDMYPH